MLDITNIKINDLVTVTKFDGYGRYDNCYWKRVKRYVKEIGNDYIVLNCKADFSGKDHKIKLDTDNYKDLKINA